MTTDSWAHARTQALTDRVIQAAVAVLSDGRPLTFREVAIESGVAERTLYRHFASRTELLTALFEWSNRRMGCPGERPTDLAGATALVRAAFPGFDGLAPVVRELLTSPEGQAVRFADKSERQRSALELVRQEAPKLSRTDARRIAAVVQMLLTAVTWQALRDYWDMDGDEAAEAVTLALTLLLRGANTRPNPNTGADS
ncbi:MAG TPA: helix-turn-helix domain-containing protein [Polyangiaceae bacterium]